MQLRANHLTIARMVLLPIPCVLLFYGSVERLVALVAFSALAATDWYDGQLARRQGPTVLGGLLDPVADKMFLAYTYIPLAIIEGVTGSGQSAVPVWIVTVIFLRELLVTGLRSVAATHSIEFKTAVLAKFKTAIQMGAGGFLCWDIVWQGSYPVMVAGNAVASLVIAALIVRRFVQRAPVGPRLWTLAGCFVGATIAAAFAPITWCLLAISLAVLSVTVASGVQYVYRVIGELARRKWPKPRGAVRLSLAEAVGPIAIVALAGTTVAPHWAVILLLTAELATGGLDNLLCTERIHRRKWIAWLRSVAVLGLGVVGWLAFLGHVEPRIGPLAVTAAATIATLYAGAVFLVHRRVYFR